MAAFPESQDPLNAPPAPSPLPGLHDHEHAAPSFLFSSRGSNNLAHASSVIPKHVPLHLLNEITNDFSKDRLLGVGAYGKVYKGVHKNGETVAVKLLHSNPGFDDAQFEKEFRNLTSLHHKNIVRLVGFCHETRREFVLHNAKMIFADSTRMALCFEYMHNGSLENYLFDEYSGPDWPTRYGIIKGISEGLKYLHEESKPPIYHLDLKPANILLDDNMMPKLADFGLSRFFGQEPTRITQSCIGTFGYLPPEFIERNLISNKLDIFSLGVIIIKIIAGPTGYSQCAEMPSEQFIELVHEKWRNRLHATSEDAMEQYSEQLMKCIEIALSCVEKERHKRPSIGVIINKLNEMETKDQRSSNQVLSVEMCSTPAKSSLLPASSYTPQETTGVSRPGEHERPVMDLVTGLAKSVVEEALKKAQAAIEEEAKLRQGAQRDLVFIMEEFQMMQSFLNEAGEERVQRNVVVRTWVRQIRELAYDVEDCIEFVFKLDSNKWWLDSFLRTCTMTNAPPRPFNVAVDMIEQLKARVEDVSRTNPRYSLISDSGSEPALAQQQRAPHAAVEYDTTARQRHAVLREVQGLPDGSVVPASGRRRAAPPRRRKRRSALGGAAPQLASSPGASTSRREARAPAPVSQLAIPTTAVCRPAYPAAAATVSPLQAARCSTLRYGSPAEGFALLLRPDASQSRLLLRGAGASLYTRSATVTPLFVAGSQPPLPSPPSAHSDSSPQAGPSRKTLSPGFSSRRCSERIKSKNRTTSVVTMAEKALCRRLGIVHEGEQVTDRKSPLPSSPAGTCPLLLGS